MQTTPPHVAVYRCLNPDSSWQSEERRLGRMFLCDLFLNATDAEIAVSIDTLARDVIADVPEEEGSSSSRRNIYIASPPSEKAIVTRVGERLTKLVRPLVATYIRVCWFRCWTLLHLVFIHGRLMTGLTQATYGRLR